MYTKKFKGWLKHWDFIMMDIACLQAAFILSCFIRNGFVNPYGTELSRGIAVFLVLADAAVLFFYGTLSGVLRRGLFQEFSVTVNHAVLVELLTVMYLFVIKEGGSYSRLALFLMAPLYVILAWLSRILLKKLVFRKGMQSRVSLLLLTSGDIAADAITGIQGACLPGLQIVGAVYADRDGTGETVSGVPVVCSLEKMLDYVCREWVDEVYVKLSADYPAVYPFIDRLVEAGVTVHQSLAHLANAPGRKQEVQKIGGSMVLTTSMNIISPKEAFIKRLFDVAGGLAGCLLTGILFVFVAPAICVQSPGPVFFTQIRVGKNGRHFKMYKFRSMYMDAEERKAELMKYNRVQDGRMFKLDFDPRIIGNKILPDGTKKTGIGEFIRKTSLDEFPQFWNVLKGDMSLVGTRPPLVEEVELYESLHRARLAVKPGITGMWQVSGRSSITDFEEVVRLDTNYINNWSIGLDLRILLKTVQVVLKREGSM